MALGDSRCSKHEPKGYLARRFRGEEGAGPSMQQGALVIFEVLCSSEHLKLYIWLCL